MADDRECAGMIVRQLERSHERCLCTILAGDSADFGVIGRYDNMIEQFALKCGIDRIGQYGPAAKIADIFARYAFAAAARGNNCDLQRFATGENPATNADDL